MIAAIYTRADLAALFGYADVRTFGHYLPTLVAAGFPAPLPLGGRCRRWSRAAVDAWIAGAQPPPASQPADHPDTDDLAAARARLAQRARR
jgi:predicted DNA-binding transcriptional regulator AlpA